MSRHDDGAPVAAHDATILVVFELSKSKWKIGVLLPGSSKLSRREHSRIHLLARIFDGDEPRHRLASPLDIDRLAGLGARDQLAETGLGFSQIDFAHMRLPDSFLGHI